MRAAASTTTTTSGRASSRAGAPTPVVGIHHLVLRRSAVGAGTGRFAGFMIAHAPSLLGHELSTCRPLDRWLRRSPAAKDCGDDQWAVLGLAGLGPAPSICVHGNT